jgi:hypothetical protein
MHTKDMLAAALDAVGLVEMSAKARTGYYHDFLSPLDLPEMALINDLGVAATTTHRHRALAITELRLRVINGDFDASAEESDDWARSQDGQETFGRLIKDR